MYLLIVSMSLNEIVGWFALEVITIIFLICLICSFATSPDLRKKIIQSRFSQQLGLTRLAEKMAQKRLERREKELQVKIIELTSRKDKAKELLSNGYFDGALKIWNEISDQAQILGKSIQSEQTKSLLIEEMQAILKEKIPAMINFAKQQFGKAQKLLQQGLFVYAKSAYLETSQLCNLILKDEDSVSSKSPASIQEIKDLQEKIEQQIVIAGAEQVCKEIEKRINDLQDNPLSQDTIKKRQIFENIENKLVDLKRGSQSLKDPSYILQKIEQTRAKSEAYKASLETADSGNATVTSSLASTKQVEVSKREDETGASFIEFSRDYEFFGGKIRFKIRIKNISTGVLTRLNLTLDLPPALMWATHEPASFVRSGNGLLIPRLGVREQIAVSFFLSPINCLSGMINATLSFLNSQDRPFAITMNPKEIDVTCPLFFTREQVNLARVKNLAGQLHYSAQKALPVVEPKNFLQVFEITIDAIHQHDVVEVSRTIEKDENQAEAWFYGVTKIKKSEMIIHLAADREKRLVVIEIRGEDQIPATALLADLEGQLRQKLSEQGIISVDNPFFDVELSVATGFCPFCAATLQKNQIDDFNSGSVLCTNCRTQITKYQ